MSQHASCNEPDPLLHAPFDQNNSAENAPMFHAQVAHGVEAAYRKNRFSAEPEFVNS
jgi:hypothetical protein